MKSNVTNKRDSNDICCKLELEFNYVKRKPNVFAVSAHFLIGCMHTCITFITISCTTNCDERNLSSASDIRLNSIQRLLTESSTCAAKYVIKRNIQREVFDPFFKRFNRNKKQHKNKQTHVYKKI